MPLHLQLSMPSFNRCTFADSNLSPSTEWIKATVRVFWIPVLIFFINIAVSSMYSRVQYLGTTVNCDFVVT